MSDKSKGILLESGTNELEVLVFTVGELRCGVNVAKVREVIGQVELTRVPKAHHSVVGVANLRGRVIPMVDLQLFFRPDRPSTATQRNYIVTEFNDMSMGFIVDSVEQIFRLSWNNVEPLPISGGTHNASVTSVCHVDGQLVMMVDFEKIAFDIQGVSVAAADVADDHGFERGRWRLLLAEDSPTMRKFIEDTLVKAGYVNVTSVTDGQAAWDLLDADAFDLVISDIEMPRMDGLHLCRRIREWSETSKLPVVIFSSLVSDDNLKKMDAVGANATLTKPQLVKLVEIVDALLQEAAQPVA
jgi:two-component system chemotaxis response regulator CheV